MQNPLINGIAYGFAEIRLDLDGLPFTALTAINYKTTVNRGKLRGTSMRPLAMTSGEVDYDADLEMAEDDYRALIKAFGDGFLKRKFDITVSMSNDDGTGIEGAVTVTDKLKGCRLKGSEHSYSQGPDGLKVRVPLDVMQILEGDDEGNFLDGVGEDTI